MVSTFLHVRQIRFLVYTERWLSPRCSGIYGHSPLTSREEGLGLKRRLKLCCSAWATVGRAARDRIRTVFVGKPSLLGKAAWVLWHFTWPVYSSQLSFGESSQRFWSTLSGADSSKHRFGRLTEGRMGPQQNQ